MAQFGLNDRLAADGFQLVHDFVDAAALDHDLDRQPGVVASQASSPVLWIVGAE